MVVMCAVMVACHRIAATQYRILLSETVAATSHARTVRAWQRCAGGVAAMRPGETRRTFGARCTTLPGQPVSGHHASATQMEEVRFSHVGNSQRVRLERTGWREPCYPTPVPTPTWIWRSFGGVDGLYAGGPARPHRSGQACSAVQVHAAQLQLRIV